MLNSINCSTVIRSPTVILMLLRESTSETYGPGSLFHHIKSLFHHISFRCTILQSFTFQSINQKYQNYLLYHLSISIRYLFANNREGIDNPFIAFGASWCLFVQVFGDLCIISYWIDTLVLSRGKYLSLFCCITLSSSREKPTQSQEVAASSPSTRSVPRKASRCASSNAWTRGV